MSKKGNKSPAADLEPTAQPEAVDEGAALEGEAAGLEASPEPEVPAPGVEDRTDGAFGEAPVDPPPAAPAKPTAADLVAKILGGEGPAADPAADAAPAELGPVQLVHGKLGEIGDPVRNPPALSPAELDALAPRLRLPGGATIRRENLTSASRHTKGLVVVVSNRTLTAPGVKV